MKSIIIFFLIVTLFGCNSTKETPDMPGTYLMISQTLTDSTNKDTKINGLKQLKIYTDAFYMYSQVNPRDSVSAFGVGSYTTDKEIVTENVIYRSRDSTIGAINIYKLDIEKSQDGYTEVVPEILIDGQKNKLTEEYLEVGKDSIKTPLDGVWKEIKSYVVRGNDSVLNDRTQYKAYYGGYFMFGQTVKDSSSRLRTGIGFGTFKWQSDSLIRETDLNSSYAIIAGHDFDVAIKMDGTDNYMQVIHNVDGTTGVEYYERLKK